MPVRVQCYLDDILVQSSSLQTAQLDIQTTILTIQNHGFSVNFKKSHTTPIRRLQHLGAIIDSSLCKVYLSLERRTSIRKLIRKDRRVSLAQLSKLLGKMISCMGIVPWARLHSRLLQWFLLPYQRQNLSASNRKVTVPHHTLRSLLWSLLCDDQGNHIQRADSGHFHNRRKSVRLGSSPGDPSGPGTVNPLGSRPQYQLARTSGHTPNPPPILSSSKREACPHLDRQRGSKGPRQQRRRDPVLGTYARSIGSGSLGGVKLGFHQGGTYFRGGKSSSRLSEQSQGGPCGMATGSGSVRGDLTEIRVAAPGPICHPDKHTASQVLLQVSDTGNRCPSMSVAGAAFVRLPTTSSDTGDHTQADPGRSRGNLDCSTLATASVVCRPCGSLNITSVEDPSRPSGPQPGQPSTSRPAVATTSRLAFEREGIARQSYSSGVILMIQASRRPSMNRIYDATWRGFCKWCFIHKLEPLSITIPNILDYLLEGLNKGLSSSTIRRQLAALSTVLSCDNSSPL
ncbi:uncharacterized protein LOC120302772 [Crotalus tigris]|uniref:uncharacterized protein LOC120302772 n=1 Tax=Crotalus tigris TaxID=88082 RepID=UPI00192F3D10|nr:uncharacterized protein LOC120302772 [Crotalus tigris]XP_039187630.1 uncharacterized protein LOC120302772 [Crotalus tigris]XP_039187631.1 uncharacterized protein LOC120302772 [Crotalus tigris]